MEEVPGIPGSLPSLAPYPTSEIQSSLFPEEWQGCLDAWIFCLEFRLRLSPEHFSFFKLSQDACGLPFLLTYLQNLASQNAKEQSRHGGNERDAKLRRLSLLLLRRLLLSTRTPLECPPARLFEVLSKTSIVYPKSLTWRDTLKQAWKRSSPELVAACESCKSNLVRRLTMMSPLDLKHAIALTRTLPECSLVFMTGSDYLEALMDAHSDLQKLTTEHAFLCLRNLMLNEASNPSLLLDHLYTLKSYADKSLSADTSQPTLLSSLVVSTQFLRDLDLHLPTLQRTRGQQLLEALRTYREQTLQLHPPPSISRKNDRKGKGKAGASGDEMHVHKASQVSQIHELFPDLSNYYILRLLDYFSDDVEAVTAGLLEPDSLPSDLKEQALAAETNEALKSEPDVALKAISTPLPRRKNVFDDDEFDNLRISSGKILMGQKDILTDRIPTLDEHARNKAAIMSALAAFDADDDERDDTYDVADVGGNVDDTVDTDSRNTNEELLYRAWSDQPALFARNSKTRVSQPRQQLKQSTGMTDEQIEGWAIMLRRDENMQSRLKQRYHASASFTGNQNAVMSTKWQQRQSDSDDNGSDDQGGRKMGLSQIRGGRHFGGRGGGNTAGPANALSTQAARKRKDQGRGRGGPNHNRREGRAKKVGRGMAGPI
jgi:activating signal cointegrator complex subunit 2